MHLGVSKIRGGSYRNITHQLEQPILERDGETTFVVKQLLPTGTYQERNLVVSEKGFTLFSAFTGEAVDFYAISDIKRWKTANSKFYFSWTPLGSTEEKEVCLKTAHQSLDIDQVFRRCINSQLSEEQRQKGLEVSYSAERRLSS